MISLISLMIGEIIVSVCENILPDYVSSLSEIITDMHHYLHNERINKKFIFKSYRNTEAGNEYKTEELSRNMIPRIYSPELTEYRKLRGNTKFFKDPDNKEYPILDIESTDITRTEELTGKKYGVLYKSPFNALIVDPIADKETIFPYERILPAGLFSGDYAGVVIVPVYQDSLILLKQFRHAVREEQLCFPRGFSESINIEEDVKREIEEELGITVNGRITQMGTLTPDSGLSAGIAAICTVQVKELPHQTHTEGIVNYRLVNESELEHMIKHLDVVDGFTISAFKMWQSHKSI